MSSVSPVVKLLKVGGGTLHFPLPFVSKNIMGDAAASPGGATTSGGGTAISGYGTPDTGCGMQFRLNLTSGHHCEVNWS